MTTRREVAENHLNAAKQALDARKSALSGRKLNDKQVKRDATYRKIEADVRKWKKRLGAFDAVVALNAEVEQRRAEKAAQPKVKKEKKKVAVAKPEKAKGGKKSKE